LIDYKGRWKLLEDDWKYKDWKQETSTSDFASLKEAQVASVWILSRPFNRLFNSLLHHQVPN
jgi:hypothetical protein